MRVLITGATGNVGREVLLSLASLNHPLEVFQGVRNMEDESKNQINNHSKLRVFDFTNTNTFNPALRDCDILFLLRPPQLSDVETYFKPIISSCISCNVKHIVFLSVQGVENSSIIPHHKIEKLIVESGIPFTFLRPAYFMQNFTTSLKANLVKSKEIYLPAGNAKFTLIDVRDIGKVAAQVLINTEKHTNKAYDLTNKQKLNFSEMANALSNVLGQKITFISPTLLGFFIKKRQERVPFMFILVMIMLHYLPRFQKEPKTTDCVEKITGSQPISFHQFLLDHKNELNTISN